MNNKIYTIDVKFIPALKWYYRATWQLLEPYTSHNGNVIVPTGFITDGASIPLIFRWLFSPTGRYFGAAIIHDYLISIKHDWTKANIEFNNEMKALHISPFRRHTILYAVELYYRLRYKYKL